MSKLTAVVRRAYLSRCRLASRSSSAKPSSICHYRPRCWQEHTHKGKLSTNLCKRILFICVFIAELPGRYSARPRAPR